jgi:hypothetical protein
MSYTLAKELASKEVDARLRELGVSVEARAVLQRMAYAVPHKRFMESKGKHTTTFPLGTADLKAQTLLSEYRISKARKELRSKVLVSWTVNRTPVPGATTPDKHGQPKAVYERNEYTINRKALGIWWEPNNWAAGREEDGEDKPEIVVGKQQPAAAPEQPKPVKREMPFVADEDDAGKLLKYCVAFCYQIQDITAVHLNTLRKKLLEFRQQYEFAEMMNALKSAVCDTKWTVKIMSGKSPLGLMVTCIPTLVKELQYRRDNPPDDEGIPLEWNGTHWVWSEEACQEYMEFLTEESNEGDEETEIEGLH